VEFGVARDGGGKPTSIGLGFRELIEKKKEREKVRR
jgi:hypothetical protein